MEYTTKTNKKIEISAERNFKPAHWNPSGHGYTITLKIGAKSTTFDFWDSYHNAKNNVDCDLRGALACFASDCLLTLSCETVKDVMEEFGYDDKKEASRILSACKTSMRKANRLGLSEDDLSELADY